MAKEIVITFDEQGEVGIDAVGFKGTACTKAIEAFERALGRAKTVTNKSEYAAIGVPVAQKVTQGR